MEMGTVMRIPLSEPEPTDKSYGGSLEFAC